MIFLLDANVLIDAHRDYYPLERVPEFWEWLLYQGEIGNVKIPLEIYEEVIDGEGPLVDWLRTPSVRGILVLAEDSHPERVTAAIAAGYAPDLRDDELVIVGRDPFLVAHACTDPGGRCVVTTEVSKPGRRRANRHVPDVCSANGVASCNTFEMIRRLDFSTRWRRPATDHSA